MASRPAQRWSASCARPSGGAVGVLVADLAGFDLPRTGYGAAVGAVSTLFMLPHAGQRSFVAAAARHLHPGGILFIEAFRFDLRRYGVDCRRAEHRPPGRHAHFVQPARPGRPRGQHHTCAACRTDAPASGM
jgi:hypothetical protein